MGHQDHPVPKADLCATLHVLCISVCRDRMFARNSICTVSAAACGVFCAVTCAASTIGYVLCLAICGGACLMIEAGCLAASHFGMRACLTECLIDRLLCESGPRNAPTDFVDPPQEK